MVPLAATAFLAGYLLVALVTLTLADQAGLRPSLTAVAWWSLLLCLVAGLPGLAAGSGRAAIWAGVLPHTLVESLVVARRILRAWLVVSLVALLVALVADFGTAANLVSQLRTGTDGAVVYSAASLLLVPNAVLFSGSYLLGPGFTVGVGTLVSPAQVVLGPLPMFPLLAALPESPAPAWAGYLVALAPLVAFCTVVQVQRSRPTLRWDEGLLRGVVGGVVAGLAFGLLAGVAGGAVGPGRMADVGPLAFEVLVHAITVFGLAGLLGGAVVTLWQRRAARSLLGADQGKG